MDIDRDTTVAAVCKTDRPEASKKDTLPLPPIPPNAHEYVGHLRGFIVDVRRMLDSVQMTASTGDEFKAAFTLFCRAWKQVPTGSLPDDERSLASLSGARSWKRVRAMALRGWRKHSDGRLYHHVVSEVVIEAMTKNMTYRSTMEKARKCKKNKREEDFEALPNGHYEGPDWPQ